VKRFGNVKIGDLGYSKLVGSLNRNTSRFPGTANYTSPEIINEQADYTNKIDVWSLGCVIYELLTLNKLFQDVTDLKIKLKILNAPITLPTPIDLTLGLVIKGCTIFFASFSS
jgi:serine/threonine protein kinase